MVPTFLGTRPEPTLNVLDLVTSPGQMRLGHSYSNDSSGNSNNLVIYDPTTTEGTFPPRKRKLFPFVEGNLTSPFR